MAQENIISSDFIQIMQKSYVDYAMSVIIARALPDVRDGLKPVQRRTLYDMHELAIHFDRPYRKCARIVGDTMGKYHPHGDSSIYDALVVMAQDFKKGLPLVDGHGNFGSIEGDSAAAMRYTEARLQKVTQQEFLADLDKDVVDFMPNFDETEKEPVVLPVRLPNFLVNGSEGIAVGMVTSTPPHNLGEVIDAVKAFMKDPSLTSTQLMKYIIGPDFPTGGIVTNKDDLPQIYETGQGRIRLRGRVMVEKAKGGKLRLVVTEIPFTMIGAGIGKFLNDVYALVESKKTTDITDISNQSSKEGIRIVLELRRGADTDQLLALLYKKTRLEDTFSVNMLAIADGRPETLSLRQAVEHFLDFQYEIYTRKYKKLLQTELSKKEIQEGLIRACDIIDLIIEILRGSKNVKMAKDCLTQGKTEGIRFKTKKSENLAKKLDFTPDQADAILQMRLYRLIGLEIDILMKEHEETLKKIAQYRDVLDNHESMSQVIMRGLDQIKKNYAVPRRTSIEEAAAIVFEEKKPEAIEIAVLIDRFGYARSVDMATLERNREAAASESRFLVTCMSDEKVCLFTSTGQLHQVRAADIPFGKFRDKAAPLDNFSGYDSSSEELLAVFSQKTLESTKLVLFTSSGQTKLAAGSDLLTSRKTIAAARLSEGDTLAAVFDAAQYSQIVIQTRKGYFLKYAVSGIPEQKRTAAGVRGISLTSGDEIQAIYPLDPSVKLTINIGPDDREICLNDLRIGTRGGRGSKV